AAGILALPVTAMGLTFPLVLAWAAAHTETGRFVGRFTAINTIGAVCGALATGYVVLPALGSERTILAVAVVFAALAAAMALSRGSLARSPLVLAAAAIVAGVVAPRWNVLRLTAGTNVYFDTPLPRQE